MDNMIRFIFYVVLFLSFMNSFRNVCAFEERNTHPKITEQAIQHSKIGTFLIQNFGRDFQGGTESIIAGKSVMDWLTKGSTDEDHPLCRASNHFHNPRLPWNQSYMTDAPAVANTWCRDIWPVWAEFSNITWATGQATRDGAISARARQNMGWDNARTYFYTALTATTSTDRETNFAKTFQAVGQVMHLLQDMAVPAHVRNDFQSHLRANNIRDFSIFNPSTWTVNQFESYVKGKPQLISSLTDTVIKPNTPAFPRATDFWDTTDTAGDSPGLGLAEIVNRSYFSDETIPGNNYAFTDPYYSVHMFPQPLLLSGTYDCMDTVPGAPEKQARYVSRTPCPAAGGNVDHFAAYSFLTSEAEIKALTADPKKRKYVLDNNVHETYAQSLLPRAVGYSAGLLNYFFRGELGAGLVSRMVTTDVVASGIKIKNWSTETMTSYTDPATGRSVGNIEIYYDAVVSSGTSTTTERRLIKSCPLATTDCWQTAPLQLAPNQETELMSLPTPTDTTTTNPNQYTIVFRGQLGNEQGAVMAGRINRWSEEWDGTELKSNHIWRTWPERYDATIFWWEEAEERIRYRKNEVTDGKLIKENTSIIASDNSTLVEEAFNVCITDPRPNGYCNARHYCPYTNHTETVFDLQLCAAYNFGHGFPIRVTPNTIIRVKIDEMSINPPLAQKNDPACTITGEIFVNWHHWQGIVIMFENYQLWTFSMDGHQTAYEGIVSTVKPGEEFAVNIYEAFNSRGIPIQEPMYIKSIDIEQKLDTSCSIEHTQRMVVDYIRIEEGLR
jgi:hypothetical protein